MRELKILTSAVLLAVMGAAHAQSEFDFAYNGTMTTFCSVGGRPCSPDFPPDPGMPRLDPWAGTISFITSSSANGVYTCRDCGGDGDLNIVLDGTPWPSWFFIPRPGEAFLPLTLTLLDGAAVSLRGPFKLDPFGTYNIGGAPPFLSFGSQVRAAEIAIDRFGIATLTPIPEPEAWALMLVGLASIGALTRKCRATHARDTPIAAIRPP